MNKESNQGALERHVSRLESHIDHLEAELGYLNTILMRVGFPEGIETLKSTAEEMLEEAAQAS